MDLSFLYCMDTKSQEARHLYIKARNRPPSWVKESGSRTARQAPGSDSGNDERAGLGRWAEAKAGVGLEMGLGREQELGWLG